MALPQQGTETFLHLSFSYKSLLVLMALPQQGTETLRLESQCLNNVFEVLMALPQQGTETMRTFH